MDSKPSQIIHLLGDSPWRNKRIGIGFIPLSSSYKQLLTKISRMTSFDLAGHCYKSVTSLKNGFIRHHPERFALNLYSSSEKEAFNFSLTCYVESTELTWPLNTDTKIWNIHLENIHALCKFGHCSRITRALLDRYSTPIPAQPCRGQQDIPVQGGAGAGAGAVLDGCGPLWVTRRTARRCSDPGHPGQSPDLYARHQLAIKSPTFNPDRGGDLRQGVATCV